MEKRSADVVLNLRSQIERLQGGASRTRNALPFGVAEIDRRLPGGGLALGSLQALGVIPVACRSDVELPRDYRVSRVETEMSRRFTAGVTA